MSLLLVIMGRPLWRTLEELYSFSTEIDCVGYLLIYNRICKDIEKAEVPEGIKEVLCVVRESFPLFYEFSRLIVNLVRDQKIKFIVFDDSPFSFWIAPMVAGELEASIITDIVKVRKERDNIVFVRPLHQESVWGEYISLSDVAVLIVRRGFPIKNIEKVEKMVKVIRLSETDHSLSYLGVSREDAGESVDRAMVVVGLGKGVLESKTIDLSFELARTLGGEVIGTKPLIESSILPRERLVGLSGKRISPKLYVALGISGSMYHLTGVLSADIIVSINKDPFAPINKLSDYYYIGDLAEVLPRLIDLLRKEKVT